MNNDMQKDTIDFLEKNKEFLQVEDTDGGKKVTFNHSEETEIVEIVDDIVVGKFSNAISLPNNLKDGKYLIYDNDNQKYYIANVLNQHINGEGKEYDENGNIIFEGEYKDGVRWNGKGEEFNPEYYSVFVGTYKEGEKVEGKEYGFFGELRFEGWYKNNERNGEGKEYDKNGNVIFEGEYKNNKWHGKGKKYDKNGKVIFEGEYENGRAWNGEGIEYDRNGILFEGEYKDGLKWNGKGKKYDEDGNVIFEGEYKYDERNGEGKEYDEDGKLIFKGWYENNERNGEGKEYDKDRNVIFEGKYKDGKKWEGKGKEYDKNGNVIFEGKYKDGVRNGEGKEYDKDGKLIFEGWYENNERNGEGKEYDADGKLIFIIFKGKYKDGVRNGEGEEYGFFRDLQFKGWYENNERNGEGEEYGLFGELRFKGKYKDGVRNGEGKEYDKNENLIFEGEYKDGVRWNGKGEAYDEDGNVIFEGKYKDGLRWDGKGKKYDADGNVIFEGKYKDGVINGEGKEYDADGNVIFEGKYKDGVRNGEGEEYGSFGELRFKGWYENNERNGKGEEYDKDGNVIFEGKYKDGLRWNGKGKIYIKTTNGHHIEKECKYNEGKKNGYEVTYYDKKSVRVQKYNNNKAVEASFYVNGEECSKVNFTEKGDTLTNSTKTNYDDTNVVVYSLVEKVLSNNVRKIQDKFGEKTQLLTKSNMYHEPDEDIKIAEGTDKLELFIKFHGADNLEAHPICLSDIRPISNKVSNAIVGSNGQIQTLTIKLGNCYGRTYDRNGNDLKAEILKDIYTKAAEKAKEEGKTLDLNKLPKILISGATIDSVVFAYGSTNEKGEKGYKRMAKKEYFSFEQKDWERVAKIMEERNKNNKDGNNENTIIKKTDSKIAIESNIKEYRDKNKELIDLFKETSKENYRQLKGYYNNRNNIDNKEPKEIETKKENNIGGV